MLGMCKLLMLARVVGCYHRIHTLGCVRGAPDLLPATADRLPSTGPSTHLPAPVGPGHSLLFLR